ncbi:MAG TPA: hypothetical protein VLH13_04765 [Methanomassiliicoccales archaeon]|nr:hypothetical protein [Methanomassiliicoccales archaeon]
MNQKALCFTCLHRENRPELGVNDQLIYCRKKDMVVRPKAECTLFYRATQQSIKALHKTLYGVLNEEGEGEI